MKNSLLNIMFIIPSNNISLPRLLSPFVITMNNLSYSETVLSMVISECISLLGALVSFIIIIAVLVF